jgi:flagellar assembly protein FliH
MSADAFAPAVFPRLHDAGIEAERERARRRGYAEGHAEGFRAAVDAAAAAAARADAERALRDAEVRRAVAEAVTTLRTAADALAQRVHDVSAATQDRVYAHAVELAAAIVAGELADGEASAASAARRALAVADPAEVREVRLHPDDLATLERLDARPAGVAFTAGSDLERGDAVVVLADGHLDARVGAAVERARRALAEKSAS